LFEDHGSARIDLACPHCQQLFKVRLRKLQFGADLICRLCRHEFSAHDVSDRVEVRKALARMHQVVQHRVRSMAPRNANGSGDHDDEVQDHHSAGPRQSAPSQEKSDDTADAGDALLTASRQFTLRVS